MALVPKPSPRGDRRLGFNDTHQLPPPTNFPIVIPLDDRGQEGLPRGTADDKLTIAVKQH